MFSLLDKMEFFLETSSVKMVVGLFLSALVIFFAICIVAVTFVFLKEIVKFIYSKIVCFFKKKREEIEIKAKDDLKKELEREGFYQIQHQHPEAHFYLGDAYFHKTIGNYKHLVAVDCITKKERGVSKSWIINKKKDKKYNEATEFCRFYEDKNDSYKKSFQPVEFAKYLTSKIYIELVDNGSIELKEEDQFKEEENE